MEYRKNAMICPVEGCSGDLEENGRCRNPRCANCDPRFARKPSTQMPAVRDDVPIKRPSRIPRDRCLNCGEPLLKHTWTVCPVCAKPVPKPEQPFRRPLSVSQLPAVTAGPTSAPRTPRGETGSSYSLLDAGEETVESAPRSPRGGTR